MATTPSPKSPEQSDKTKKYDRQLRLWGDHGQVALEAAHVCLLNATATGTETLKSIILPGVGNFTIVDNHKVTGQDAGNNFFLDADSRGRNRGEIACRLLKELNPDVTGDFIDDNLENICQHQDFFNNFTIVIACDVPEKILVKLSGHLWEKDIPLVVCRSLGMIGYIRIQVKEHTIIESHPDNPFDDLRLDRPFPHLIQHMDSIDLDKLDKQAHAHVPWLVILYKYLKVYKEKEGELPKTYRQKCQLKEMIRQGIWTSSESENEVEEENFEEAMKAVNKALAPTDIPSSVKQIFQDDASSQITSQSTPFWILAKAMRMFTEKEGAGALPVRGTIPDMTADSKQYIALQNVYREQAGRDVEAVYRHTRHVLQEIGRPVDSISENDVKLFCRNAHCIRLLRGTSILNEYDTRPRYLQDLSSELEDSGGEFVWYVVLRAVERFRSEYGQFPGETHDQAEPDIARLKSHVSKLLCEWGVTSCAPLIRDDYIHEACRYGGSEPHALAAIIGGCAAHEVIKILTRQYIPLDNTFIYNGIRSTSQTYQL